MSDRFSTCTVLGPIYQKEGAIPPVLVLCCKPCSKTRDKQAENVVVSVYLSECTVKLTVSAYRKLHRNSWIYVTRDNAVNLATHPPLSPLKTQVIDPTLIQIQYPNTTS